jgi:hypothetical protein
MTPLTVLLTVVQNRESTLIGGEARGTSTYLLLNAIAAQINLLILLLIKNLSFGLVPQLSQANLAVADSSETESTDPGAFPPSITYTDSGELPNLIFVTDDDSQPIISSVPILHEEAPKSAACLYDSGANRHVFNDRAAFETYELIQPLSVKAFGNSLSTTAVGPGSIRLECRYGSRPSSFLITNVLHIPLARSNLISGTQLAAHGVLATLGKSNLVLTYNGIFLLDGFVDRGMYCLNTKPIPRSPTLLSRISPTVATLDIAQAGFYTA